MWPFKKKTPEREHITMIMPSCTSNGIPIQSYGNPEYLQRQARKEKKMELQVGKWYETASGVHECKAGPVGSGARFEVGGGFYYEDGYPIGGKYINPILREVPAPLKLEVGEFTEIDALLTQCDCPAPNKKSLRYCKKHFREYLQRRAEHEQAQRTAIPVTYRTTHHDDRPCERGTVIPDGYEKVRGVDVKAGDLYVNRGFWDTAGDSRAECARKNGELSGLFIRPKKAFRVDGAGWYRSRDGSWINMTGGLTNNIGEGWFDDGRHDSADRDLDLISKATPQQAAVLEAL